MQRLEEQRYDCAFASLPEPTLLVDEDAKLLLVNAAAVALLGANPVLASPGASVSRALPWLGPAVSRVLAGSDEDVLEAKVSTPTGPRRVAARLRRVRERSGAPCGVVAVLEDVTDKLAVEARKRSAVRIAALGSLAADLAHEVNNPLACVIAGLSFLESEHARIASALAPAELVEAKVALEEARDAALRVGRILHSLQSLGRPTTPLLQEVELSGVLRAATRLAEPELRGRARVVEEIADLKARTSESLVVEVFLALIVHAGQAVEPGNPAGNTIHVKLVAARDEPCAIVTIMGPAPAHADASGGRAAARRTSRGGGPRLSFSQGIVTALGGTLTLNCQPSGGTMATVRLPLDVA